MKSLTEERLAKLARLPWFRYGYMPDWLREQLIKDLSLSQEDKIRTVLYKLFLTALSNKEAQDFNLEIAFNEKVVRWLLLKWFKSASNKSSLCDQVFLAFMENRLAVRVPKKLQMFLVEYSKKWIPNLKKVNPYTKRTFDIVVSAALLIFLSPMLLIFALLIRLDSKGPVLFSQARIGKGGHKFRLWKFRSLYIDAKERMEMRKINEKPGEVLFNMENDPRITPVGKFIRKYSIDELPQLWNVLIGDMSLVGPRPPLPDEVAQYTPDQRQRLKVTPGITYTWSISGRS